MIMFATYALMYMSTYVCIFVRAFLDFYNSTV